ncbi:LuxR C-terminal-related transcriptional regulator [Streptomyces sp. NPDC088261]|uniref:LuxR C-terminal-related transcriptional regulator n=1 Tax=Streptomyces sp. NPDC088261 TaxID=3365851 RepID=UPI003826DA2E
MSEAVRLHGREDEQRRLGGFLTRAGSDSPPVLIVDGQPGIGKSRLLHEAAHRARQQGLAVRHHSMADLRALVSTGMAHRPGAPAHRTLIVVDDVETLTAAELNALVRFTRRDLPVAPALLLARDAKTQRASFEQPLQAAGGAPVDRLELDPLAGGAVRGLVRDLIGVPPQAGLLDVVNCANGNPRLIVELVEGLTEEGRIGPEGELLRLTPGRLPIRVQGLIQDQLRQLSRESVQLLRVGTILGRTFPLSGAAVMLGTGTAGLLSALEETAAAGLLTLADDGVSFQHPLVRRAVYESIPEGVRATLHHEARQLTARPAAPVEDFAEPLPEEGTPERYGTGAPGGARTVGAVRTLLRTGHVEAAVLLVRGVLDRRLPAHEEMVLKLLMTDVLLSSGHAGAVFAAGAPRAQARTGGLTETCADLAIDRLAAAGPEAARVAAAALSGLEWAEGRTAQAVHWGRRAVDHLATPSAPARHAYHRLSLAAKLVPLGGVQEAEGLLRQVRGEQSADEDRAVYLLSADLVQAAAHLRAGEPDAARQRARDALNVASAGRLPGLAAWASATLCRTELFAGDTEAAARHLARCREYGDAAEAVPHLVPYRQWLDVLLHAARNDVREAAGLLTTSAGHLPSLRPLLLAEPGAAAWFVRFSRRVADRTLADTALKAVEWLAADNPDVPAVQLAALHARSLYECAPDGIARVAAEHQDAWARICAAEDLRALLDERRVAQAALPEPSSPRHGPWMARNHVGRMTVVEAADYRRPAPEPAADTLNDIERTIAGLVVEGLTNRQVAQHVHLSPHTVNYYLRRIYGKLGIRSRVELARHIHDHGLGAVCEGM